MSWRETFPTFHRAVQATVKGGGRIWAAGRWLWQRARRIFRPAMFILASLVTLVALLWAEETYRTGKAWEKYQAELEAQGVKLSMAELAPPPVPDDQNFAMTPLLKLLYGDEKSRESMGNRLLWFDPSREEMPGLGNWQISQRADLAKWEDYFHQPVLEHLKKFDPEMAEISAAVRRPYSRFPVDYTKQPATGILILEISPLLTLEKMFALHGTAELAAGQNEAALDDAITVLRLSQANANEPMLISGLTSAAMLSGGMQVVWEGLAGHHWTEPQLANLQQQIQKIDFMAQAQRDLQGERAFFTSVITWQETQDFSAKITLAKRIVSSSQSQHYLAAMIASTRLALNRALLTGNQWYEQEVFPRINLPERRFDPSPMPIHYWQWSQRWADYAPEAFIVRDILPTMNGCLAVFAHTQATLDQAAVACALERYRLAHGAYPEKLDDLVPQFIAQLPRDDISGGLLHYQLRPDGTFLLYSVGWTGKDNHGVLLQKDMPQSEKDNWVWQYPAR